jgi:acetate kinase
MTAEERRIPPDNGSRGHDDCAARRRERAAHGGDRSAKSAIIDDAALAAFRDNSDLAPLHNPPNLTGVEDAREVLPRVPHCAIMDTAWHQTMPPTRSSS